MYRASNPNAPGLNTFKHDDYNYSTDSHTKVHYKENSGYFQRLGSSFCGIGIGFLILFASFPLLFWNEGRAVQTARSLDEGLSSVVKLTSIDSPTGENNNKLVHLTGRIHTLIALRDDEFGIRIHATHLRRHVEMYQWVETEHKREYKEGDQTRVETTYSYHTEWKSEIIRSNAFSNSLTHKNPSAFPIAKHTKTANPVHIGGFQLSEGLKSGINDFKTYYPKEKPDDRDDLILQEHYFYRSADLYKPKVGDLRISFSYAGLTDSTDLGDPMEVSIIARQNGMFLSPYKTTAGDSLEFLYVGNLLAEEIFKAEHTSNSYLTWGIRFAGWLMMFIAFQIVMDIFRQIVSFLPIIRDIVSLATSLLALTFATSISLVVISIGWFYYRPFLSLTILLTALIPIYLSRQKAQKEKEMERE